MQTYPIRHLPYLQHYLIDIAFTKIERKIDMDCPACLNGPFIQINLTPVNKPKISPRSLESIASELLNANKEQWPDLSDLSGISKKTLKKIAEKIDGDSYSPRFENIHMILKFFVVRLETMKKSV